MGCSFFIACCKELLEFSVVVCTFVSGIGTIHIPSEGCLVPFKINFLSLIMCTNFLVKYTKQSSSYSYPTSKSDADVSEGKTCSCFPAGKS